MDRDDITLIKDSELYESIIKGALGTIPIVGGVIVELWNYFDARLIERRLQNLEQAIQRQQIDISSFQNRLLSLSSDEHKFYCVRNNLRHLLLAGLPETVEVLNKSLIEMVMTDHYGMSEHACEIIRQLNADDIHFLELVAAFQKEGVKEYQQHINNQAQASAKRQESLQGERKGAGYVPRIWIDRNIQFGGNTIFWNDFAQHFGMSRSVTDPSILLNAYCADESGNTIDEWAYILRSMHKLQSLGVLVCEITLTTGTSSLSNIERFHLTFFGQKILSYLKDTDVKTAVD